MYDVESVMCRYTLRRVNGMLPLILILFEIELALNLALKVHLKNYSEKYCDENDHHHREVDHASQITAFLPFVQVRLIRLLLSSRW